MEVSLPWVITIVFIILKLVGVIAWSWWWVFSPVLITAGLIIVVLAFTALIAFIVSWKH